MVTHRNPAGRVEAVIDPAGNTTRFGYDSTTGRKTSECDARGKCSYFAYGSHGEVLRIWGQTSYPIEHVYDAYGRHVAMRSFRQQLGWQSPAWPNASDAIADESRWVYEEATGLMVAKVDAANRGPSYVYAPGGRVARRTWPRTRPDGLPLATRYTYDQQTAELVAVDYNDETPDVLYRYDRLGRRKAVTDGAGVRAYTYDPRSLAVVSEAGSGETSSSLVMSYSTSGVKGRLVGIKAGDQYAVGYGYDEFGRMETLNWAVDGVDDQATYAYLPNSDLLSGLTTASGLETSYSYASTRDLKMRVSNRFDGNVVSQYEYEYDAVGRRTSVKNASNAFAQPAFSRWGYDDRSQLAKSERFLATNLDDESNVVGSEFRAYEYDDSGNRTSATAESSQTNYVSDSLNQYESVGVFTPSYDYDGNLVDDGAKAFQFNAENQLVEVVVPGVSRTTYFYDFMGRRVKKVVEILDGSASDYSIRSVYSGWNKIREITKVGSTTTSKSFVWGLDIAQNREGGGGVGALVAATDGSGMEVLPGYDGSGNVTELIDASSGNSVAHYEYDAFGNTLSLHGTRAGDNAYRFSSKEYDSESGLYY